MRSGRGEESLTRLELTAEHRRPKRPDLGIGSALSRATGEVRDRRRRVGNAADALAAAIPPTVLGGIELVSLERGVLTVRARSSAAQFVFDRELRSGGRERLIRASASSIRRIRVVRG